MEKNHATRIFEIHFNGDDYVCEVACEIWDTAEPTDYLTRSEVARLNLAERLKEFLEQSLDEVKIYDRPVTMTGGIISDLLTWAVNQIDWLHIADQNLSDFDGYESL